MISRLFQLPPIDLHTGYYNKATADEHNPTFIPDQLLIYFLVIITKEEAELVSNWDEFTTPLMLEDSLLEIGTLRKSFDEEEFKFKFDNIDFKVLETDGMWSWILGKDVTTEVRIVHSKRIDRETCDLKGVFYGIVDKNTVSHSNDVGPDDGNWELYRQYEFTVIDFLSCLREISISDLRDFIDSGSFDYFARHKVTGDTTQVNGGIATSINLLEQALFEFFLSYYNSPNATLIKCPISVYINIEKIFKAIFSLIFPLHSLTVKSDTIFRHDKSCNEDTEVIDGFLDTDREDKNILIRFKNAIYSIHVAGIPEGQSVMVPPTVMYSGTSFDFKNTFFDEDTSKTTYSFFRYGNCLELLKELLFSFGLLWHTHIILTNILCPWKFEFVFKLMTRFQSELNPILTSEILNNVTGNIVQKLNSVIVTTSSGSIINYELDPAKIPSESAIIDKVHTSKDGKLEEKFEWFTKVGYATPNDKMKNITTPFISIPSENWFCGVSYEEILFDTDCYQCLWIVYNNQTYPVNKFICSYFEDEIETYPQKAVVNRFNNYHNVTNDEYKQHINKDDYKKIFKHPIHRLHFAEMVANYYGGKYGIYNKLNIRCLTFMVDTLEVNLLDKIEIRYINYIVVKTEKDFLQGTTKLELRELK
jgi:hypothetical protein